MKQISIPLGVIKLAESRAQKDPRYSHKDFGCATKLIITIIEDYGRKDLLSRQEVEAKNSDLENLIGRYVKYELSKNGFISGKKN